MLSKEEVKHIAKLSRLDLTDAEIEKMQKDLSEILSYFDLLKSASVPPKRDYGETKKANALRSDEAVPQSREVVEKIIQSAPDKKDDYIKVRTIL